MAKLHSCLLQYGNKNDLRNMFNTWVFEILSLNIKRNVLIINLMVLILRRLIFTLSRQLVGKKDIDNVAVIDGFEQLDLSK